MADACLFQGLQPVEGLVKVDGTIPPIWFYHLYLERDSCAIYFHGVRVTATPNIHTLKVIRRWTGSLQPLAFGLGIVIAACLLLPNLVWKLFHVSAPRRAIMSEGKEGIPVAVAKDLLPAVLASLFT